MNALTRTLKRIKDTQCNKIILSDEAVLWTQVNAEKYYIHKHYFIFSCFHEYY